ncbi:MarR family transcriptional regulator [Streptomyces sp. A0642]|uniref:MarR family transcriptional regulator n=1 Tax=Streptomyces sp. A0642 TaxID=2563100 RepID=UPI0010A20726|nr:MarR family transcriptional regulator [Streptomyces sp. A0642]THA74466.1 MarR family transcriptional regulator [Streptomyces sp. A0642]
MATQNLSAAPPAPALSAPNPKARPGYGKRSVPDQLPSRADDFAFLPVRERYIAGYVDALPEGAAMSIKALAKCQPLYGQMAVGSALRALGVAGHLRHARCAVGEGDQVRWVTLTFWSRTARDNEWWNTFLAAEAGHRVPQPVVASVASPAPPPPWAPAEPAVPAAPEAPVAPVAPVTVSILPQQRVTPADCSSAYLALSRLGPADKRLALSDDDCRELEELAAEWFARGADADYFIHALTAGLPETVESPRGFVRKRLLTKLPPHRPATPVPAAPGASAPRLMIECTDCGAPGKAEAFRDGLCGPCRRPAEAPAAVEVRADGPGIERDIQVHVARLRERLAMR